MDKRTKFVKHVMVVSFIRRLLVLFVVTTKKENFQRLRWDWTHNLCVCRRKFLCACKIIGIHPRAVPICGFDSHLRT